MSRINGIRLKIERAKEHILELYKRIALFANDEPYEIGAKPHSVAQIHHTTLYIKSVKPVPDEFSIIIGDVVHNLRSSLDHLIWQLVEAGGGTPNDRTYFPVCYGSKGAQQYSSAVGAGEIQKMRIGAEKVLLSVQPYVSGNDTLWNVHELDRIDKHRVLITTGTSFGDWSVDAGGGAIIPFQQWTNIPLVVGYEIVNLPTETYNRQPHKNFKLGIEVTFGESEVVESEAVLPALKEMAEFVDRLVSQFEPFLI
jgi:hypothetical protein